MMPGHGQQIAVPPGFRFHPTDEELLSYYLRKKVAYEPIDLDVIRDVDLNRLEPWDLKEKCRIGSGPQNEWYFFSHKDKKYPTGSRTNRATTAGFWKATGRDKAIHMSNSRRIGMRKTLVFYTGRAPNGQKTDWIMHEYRLEEDDSSHVQEEGWVVCRVFKKKTNQRGPHPDALGQEVLEHHQFNHMSKAGGIMMPPAMDQVQTFQMPWDHHLPVDGSMQLPQLLSAESAAAFPPFNPSSSLSITDIECSQNLMKLMTAAGGGGGGVVSSDRFGGDWSILDKLLSSHQNLDHALFHGRINAAAASPQLPQTLSIGGLVQRFPQQYSSGCDNNHDLMKFAK